MTAREMNEVVTEMKKTFVDEFYNIFFGAVDQWASLDGLVDGAQKLADNFGLGAIDALDVAAAIALGASEFVTTQPVDRPVHRVEGVDVVAI